MPKCHTCMPHVHATMGGDRLHDLVGRYGSQAAHQRIASPAAVADARRKRMAARVGAIRHDEDYIPVDAPPRTLSVARTDGADLGPHPHSAVPREEDDVGDAEDELAEYTGATERIPLGRDAEHRQKQARRAQIRHLLAQAQGDDDDGGDVEDIPIVVRTDPPAPEPRMVDVEEIRDGTRVYDEDPFGGVPDEPMPQTAEDEDGDWERVQLGRIGVQEPSVRDESPAPAAVPLTAALPTPTSCIGRLAARLTALDESCAMHQQRIADAHAAVEHLSDDSEARANIAVLEERAAWYGDLEAFVDDLAQFIDAKRPQLEALEDGVIQLLSNRTASRHQHRALVFEDALALAHGVSGASLWPAPREGAERRRTNADGGWQTPARRARLSALSDAVPDSSAQWLSAEETSQFDANADELRGRHARLFGDTHLAEFRDPAATDEDGALLPQSLAARFADWRTRFADDYNRAWGGLALASAWEFWARAEQALWDLLWPGAQDTVLEAPADGVDAFAWLAHVMEYVDQGGEPTRGGDDEVAATLVSNVVVARLVALAENRAYDPWSGVETRAAVALADHVAQVIEGERLKTVARAFLSPFREHLAVMQDVFSAPVTHAPPPIHPDTPRAKMYVVEQLAVLAHNLFQWHVLWSKAYAPWSDAELQEYAAVTDALVALVHAAAQNAREFGSDAVVHALAAAAPPSIRS